MSVAFRTGPLSASPETEGDVWYGDNSHNWGYWSRSSRENDLQGGTTPIPVDHVHLSSARVDRFVESRVGYFSITSTSDLCTACMTWGSCRGNSIQGAMSSRKAETNLGRFGIVEKWVVHLVPWKNKRGEQGTSQDRIRSVGFRDRRDCANKALKAKPGPSGGIWFLIPISRVSVS